MGYLITIFDFYLLRLIKKTARLSATSWTSDKDLFLHFLVIPNSYLYCFTRMPNTCRTYGRIQLASTQLRSRTPHLLYDHMRSFINVMRFQLLYMRTHKRRQAYPSTAHKLCNGMRVWPALHGRCILLVHTNQTNGTRTRSTYWIAIKPLVGQYTHKHISTNQRSRLVR